MKINAKQCNTCRKTKPIGEFYADSTGRDGLKSSCKACVKKECAVYRKAHRKQRAEAARAKRNSDVKSAREYERSKYASNPQKHIARNAAWQKENRAWRRTYQKVRLDGDPRYAIERRLRGRLWHALRGSIKAASTFDLVGCSPSELMRHIESQFVDGMNWDNRTEWHIDHIRPCDSYDMSKESQQRECFHYTNLQPLWRSDNLRKGKKHDGK